MGKGESEKKDFFSVLGYQVLIHTEKPTNKAYILYNIKNNTYHHNLSPFMVFNMVRNSKPLELFKLLSENKNRLKEDSEEFLDYVKRELIDNKAFQNEFYNQININNVFINKIDFRPIPKRIFKSKGYTYLNLYNFNMDFLNIKPNINAKFPNIEIFLRNIWGNNDEMHNKFLDVCAFKLQYPLEPLTQCNFIIQDDGGTGKSSVFYKKILDRLFCVNSITQIDLGDKYNSFLCGCQWVFVEEVESFKDAKRIKALTGASKIRINEKYEKAVMTNNYSSMIICSNEINPLHIDERDRRFNVGGGGLRLEPLPGMSWSETLFKSEEKYNKFYEDFNTNLDDEIKNMYSHLIARKVSVKSIQRIVNTQQREELINLGKTTEKLFIDDIIKYGMYEVLKLCKRDYSGAIVDLIHHFPSGQYMGYWVKFSDFYDIYLDYHRYYLKNPKLPIGTKSFYSRLIKYKPSKQIIGNKALIRIKDEPHRCIELKGYKDIRKEPIDI